MLRRFWSRWQRALILVQHATIVGWHRAGFKLYWTWLSRHRKLAGRKSVSGELCELIFCIVAENPTWGAPRIHGELMMLGFDIAERFVGCCRRDMLDHLIVLNERHLKRLIRDYIRYFHEDRTHLGLAKETPAGRVKETNPRADCRVVALLRLGGLHHRYQLAA